mgnify:CR=1 FL=1
MNIYFVFRSLIRNFAPEQTNLITNFATEKKELTWKSQLLFVTLL